MKMIDIYTLLMKEILIFWLKIYKRIMKNKFNKSKLYKLLIQKYLEFYISNFKKFYCYYKFYN